MLTDTSCRRDDYSAQKLINKPVLFGTKVITMAASLKLPQKAKMDFNIDKQTYDDFMKICSKKGYAPNIIAERLLKKYNETGQI
jgi:hypothetical protein